MSRADSPSLEKLLAGAQLPALPQSAIRLLQLSQDPENGPPEFAVPIEADPGLSSQVLRFVNSSYFGFSQEIGTVRLAITLVGIRTIKNFALWSAVFSLMPNPRCGPFELKKLWQDSLRRGLFARALGRQLKLPEAEEMFAAALLQDMAIPLLAKELPDQYTKLLQSRAGGNVHLSQLEADEFGWTHADAAGHMSRGWKLPEHFARLTECHTQLDELLAANDRPNAEIGVSLSSLLPSSSDDGWPERDQFMTALTQTGCRASVTELFQAVDEDFDQFAPMLKLNNVAGGTLVDRLETEELVTA